MYSKRTKNCFHLEQEDMNTSKTQLLYDYIHQRIMDKLQEEKITLKDIQVQIQNNKD